MTSVVITWRRDVRDYRLRMRNTLDCIPNLDTYTRAH